MEQDSINKSLYDNYYHVYEPQQSSNLHSYEKGEVKRCNASEQIISPKEIALSSFGSVCPPKVNFYNIPTDPIYSVESRLAGNNLSNISLLQQVTDNYSDYRTFSPTAVSSVCEKSQEILDESSSTVFSNNTTCAVLTPLYDCFDGVAMDCGMAPNIYIPEIHFFEDLKIHGTDQTDSSENCWKDLTSHLDSINSIPKCGTASCDNEDDFGFSSATLAGWHQFVHEQMLDHDELTSNKIGEINYVVKVDESKFDKKKYNRVHYVEDSVFLWGIERDSGNAFLVAEYNRTEDALIRLIKEWIQPETNIIFDCWKGI
ncbi:DDE_Tnp_IS1595 domain-containing protein [Nephila pilipes]|uniref:DDE_Tnp_IS1595 domain-containing protein n=1 Tax=Nephila pilipes TaxID=299642 RepID=A0A8X6TBB9_NEPPI|nr:DDE_Tnp_IS1595 domain-containing protein [Nephila pilipes]